MKETIHFQRTHSPTYIHVCACDPQNAYKATIESAQRKNLNSIPPIQIRIFPGKDEVCVRVRDYVS